MNRKYESFSRRNFLKFTSAGMMSLLVGGLSGCINSENIKNTSVNNKDAKKIVMITGSPHKDGTTSFLAERFIEGAESNGHKIYRFDAAFENVKPCNGCEYCKTHNEQCVFADSMEKLNPEISAADLIVLVTPLYYFSMTRQIKGVIDRFYSHNSSLQDKNVMLLMACGSSGGSETNALLIQYQSLCRYMKWKDKGTVLARGCRTREDLVKTDFPKQARELGFSV